MMRSLDWGERKKLTRLFNVPGQGQAAGLNLGLLACYALTGALVGEC